MRPTDCFVLKEVPYNSTSAGQIDDIPVVPRNHRCGWAQPSGKVVTTRRVPISTKRRYFAFQCNLYTAKKYLLKRQLPKNRYAMGDIP